jgi:hypothetical protein
MYSDYMFWLKLAITKSIPDNVVNFSLFEY